MNATTVDDARSALCRNPHCSSANQAPIVAFGLSTSTYVETLIH